MNGQRTLLPDPRAADEHGSMNRIRLAALLLLGTACQAPAPRIPFTDDGSRWHASVVGGQWIVNKSFVEDTDFVGVEVVLGPPATGGWAWEAGFRYATGDGDGRRLTADGSVVDSEREIDYYELDVGVRQTFRDKRRLQPYLGVGGSLLQSRSEEHFVETGGVPTTDHERSEYRPGIYGRIGVIWNALRDQLREDTEFPISFDVRGLLSIDYSYLEFSIGIGFGK